LNFIPNKRPVLGMVCFMASQVTFGLVGIVVAFLANRLMTDGYEAAGWSRL
jgi:hypothetical protein